MESIELFLKNIGEDRLLEKFRENEIDMELLKTLPDKSLDGLLTEIGLKPGTRVKIMHKREEMLKNKGKIEKKIMLDFQTICLN